MRGETGVKGRAKVGKLVQDNAKGAHVESTAIHNLSPIRTWFSPGRCERFGFALEFLVLYIMVVAPFR